MKSSIVSCTVLAVAFSTIVSALSFPPFPPSAIAQNHSAETWKLYEEMQNLPYPLVPMTWTGELTDGTNVTFNGTIEAVGVELEKVEPGIMALKARSMEKRSFLTPRTPIWTRCVPEGDETWGHAWRRVAPPHSHIRPIEDAIRYLKTVGGRCEVPARSCARISYSWEVGVFLCNDNDFRIGPWCDYQGYAMVQWINDNCHGRIWNCEGNGDLEASGGKVGDHERYTVTLQKTCGG